ncbi:hypothetical protein Tco_0670681 [Tanacetum coccineum]
MKKARTGGIVIPKPVPTSAKDFVSSSVTPTLERECHDESVSTQGGNARTRPASEHFVVLSSSSETLDMDATTSPRVDDTKASSLPRNDIGASSLLGNKTGTSSVHRNRTGTSSLLRNKAGASSFVPDDGAQLMISSSLRPLILLQQKTYMFRTGISDAEFLDLLNMNSAQHVDVRFIRTSQEVLQSPRQCT